MAVPSRSEIVIIGGGVVGVSIAYHLARKGTTDVTLVERRALTEGSTWHAAGLVGQLRSSASLTQLMRTSVQTYRTLEESTGYPTGWHGVGGLRIASSPQRWQELQRIYTQGKSFGFDIHLVGPAEAKRIFPLLDTDGVHGATWTPSDGYVDPNQLTHSFAAGARAAGVRIVQRCRVESIERHGRRVTAVHTELGRIECDVVVNATGMWGAETARLAGVAVAVNAVEHQYVVTEKGAGLPADLPTFRDPDARFYLKPEAGSLVVGGWEEGTRACWRTIPRDLGAKLFPPNHQRFEVLAAGAANRLPAFGDMGIHTWVNGPIPFTPDAEPLMGLTEDLDNLFHCCGFSAGIAAAGGAGAAMADWIVDGDPGLDLWPFDVRRFGAPHTVPTVQDLASVAAYGHYYAIAFPNGAGGRPRGQRRSAVHDRLHSRGAAFGNTFGYERADWFHPGHPDAREVPTFGRSNAWGHIAAEHRAVRTGVGIIDQSSLAKFEIAGSNALTLLQRIAGADLDTVVGKVTHTQLLNERGGIEADVTVTRLAADRFYLVTASGLGRHDVTFLLQHAPADGTVVVTDVTSAHGVLTVCGPLARAVVAGLSTADFGAAAFPYLAARQTDLGWAPVLALRTTCVGELGWEFHVPTEYVRDLYDKIVEAGAPHGLRDVGHRAMHTLRLEKQYLAWGTDMRADNNPFEVGLGHRVRLAKPALLAGPALRAIAESGATQRLRWFTTDDDVVMHGGEMLVHRDSDTQVSVRSAGFGHTIGRTTFSAYLPAGLPARDGFEVEVMNRRSPATLLSRPMYDPGGQRIRA